MEGKANKKYKDSVFVDLFYEDESAEENEISLYNALHEEPLPEGTEIRKIRVENVLYMNFKNDISFDVGGKLIVFGEHQSTVNENMPLRNLLYVGRAYEQLVPVKDRYKKKQVKLPKPEFYTFYNGEEEWAKEKELKLSDAYRESSGEEMLDLKVKMININPEQHHEILEKCPVLGEYSQFVEVVRKHQRTGDGEEMLDLKVKMININPEQHHEILEKCPVLGEYSQFVEVVRKHQRTGEENALQNAVDECIKRGILSEYLRKKGSEAVNMLIAEYDYDMDIKVQREEAKEEGITLGTVNDIIELLEDIGEVPENLKNRIMKEENRDILRKWLKLAAKAGTVEEFEKNIEK